MHKRFLVGVLMMIGGLGLLAPPAWALSSPLLLYALGGPAILTSVIATLGGTALLYTGARRLLTPQRARG